MQKDTPSFARIAPRLLPQTKITMKYQRLPGLFGSLFLLLSCSSALAQDRVFSWLPANDERVRLDPGYYHTGRTYHPGSNGGNNHVDIKSQKPITIFMTPEADWNAVLQNPRAVAQLRQVCLREHVVDTTYVCDMPAEPMTLIIRDDRASLDPAVLAGLGAVLDRHDKTDRAVSTGIAAVFTGQGPVPRLFASPNDVHIQYYRWDCVEFCIQPEIQWLTQVKEKYELSSFLKVYGGFLADHDNEQVSIKIKAPVPMLVAMLPSSVANQLYAKPELLEPALEKTSCQQRAVQSLQFECTFDMTDGPQSLIVVPEASQKVPKKKAEIQMWAARCVANCNLLASRN
jgi:hypothetical protein